jgi:transcriptional regulator with XRE-family HTH domain
MGATALHTPRYRRMCAQLRAWRLEAGLTQRALAAKLKRPYSFVYKTENAERRIDPLEFIDWARAAGVERLEALRQLERF